ncbi:unnamed protein product [Fraxinus pennsylvanica]|uniref:VPS28 N-terminal domain-containing protein n=1 Tax=Fraxinus pennsylvanica TaxID=56036 RepID=A0AAD1Z8Y5_9LAMI|nr:unnamed protein product [Fraxinus pennsylvanica]
MSSTLKDIVPSIEQFHDTYKMDCPAVLNWLVTSGVLATVEHRATAALSTTISAAIVSGGSHLSTLGIVSVGCLIIQMMSWCSVKGARAVDIHCYEIHTTTKDLPLLRKRERERCPLPLLSTSPRCC